MGARLWTADFRADLIRTRTERPPRRESGIIDEPFLLISDASLERELPDERRDSRPRDASAGLRFRMIVEKVLQNFVSAEGGPREVSFVKIRKIRVVPAPPPTRYRVPDAKIRVEDHPRSKRRIRNARMRPRILKGVKAFPKELQDPIEWQSSIIGCGLRLVPG